MTAAVLFVGVLVTVVIAMLVTMLAAVVIAMAAVAGHELVGRAVRSRHIRPLIHEHDEGRQDDDDTRGTAGDQKNECSVLIEGANFIAAHRTCSIIGTGVRAGVRRNAVTEARVE